MNTNSTTLRSGLRINSHGGAELLARLFYGLPLPHCYTERDSYSLKRRLVGFRERGAITDDNQVTPFGVTLLQLYARRPTKRCSHCLHHKHPIEFGRTESTWCLDCRREEQADRRAGLK